MVFRTEWSIPGMFVLSLLGFLVMILVSYVISILGKWKFRWTPLSIAVGLLIVMGPPIGAYLGSLYARHKRAARAPPMTSPMMSSGMGPGMPPMPPLGTGPPFGAGLPLSPSYQGPPMFAPPFYGPTMPYPERWWYGGDSLYPFWRQGRRYKGCGGCNKDWMPVCGEDGNTYRNSCCADNAGVDIAHPGKCEEEEE